MRFKTGKYLLGWYTDVDYKDEWSEPLVAHNPVSLNYDKLTYGPY